MAHLSHATTLPPKPPLVLPTGPDSYNITHTGATISPPSVPPPNCYRTQERSTRETRCQMGPVAAKAVSYIFNHRPNFAGCAFVMGKKGARPGVLQPHQDLHTSLPAQHGPINISCPILWLWQPFAWFSLQFSSLLLYCLSIASSACTNAPSQETLRTPTLVPEIFTGQELLARQAAWGNLARDGSVSMAPGTPGGGSSFPPLLTHLLPE